MPVRTTNVLSKGFSWYTVTAVMYQNKCSRIFSMNHQQSCNMFWSNKVAWLKLQCDQYIVKSPCTQYYYSKEQVCYWTWSVRPAAWQTVGKRTCPSWPALVHLGERKREIGHCEWIETERNTTDRMWMCFLLCEIQLIHLADRKCASDKTLWATQCDRFIFDPWHEHGNKCVCVLVCAYQKYVRLLDWALCLCLYTSTRIRGSESRAKMQAAMAKATGTEPVDATDRLWVK